MSKPFYITTPIYYVNAEPHIGHAYTTIVADVLSRFHRIAGEDTYFLTGTDEHGDKIALAAEKAGESPRAYVDRISDLFKALWPKLKISNDYFIRTTDTAHQEVVRHILQAVYDKGDIYFSEYSGKYCFGCERFYTDRELIDGKCPDHQKEPEIIKEANYFFRMSRYQEWLIDHIQRNPDFIRPRRYKNEVLSFLKEPLEDLCISRPKTRLTWGITLPFDDQYVTYVWFDALINYISALDFPEGRLFGRFWPVAQHLIAKDILKPHGIYWPCMLKAADIEPYQHLNVHGYWNVDQGKMSKSVGNVVSPLDLVDIYGLDAFRYFLLRDMVFGLDSDFSEEALVARINADLANDLGNLFSRTLTMVHKYFKGNLPGPGPEDSVDEELKKSVQGLIDPYTDLMNHLGFHKALMAVWDVIGKLNKYIDSKAPWVLVKSDPDQLKTVLFHLVESQRVISTLIWPFMPETAEKMQSVLGLSPEDGSLRLSSLGEWGGGRQRKTVSKAPHLFPRVETGKEGRKEKRRETVGTRTEERITFQEFQRLELKTGIVKTAEEIPGSKKLLKLVVDIGEDRTLVAGIKGHYSLEELPGKPVVIVANLEPAKLMGVESQGMVLAAEDENGVHLLAPDEGTPPGTKVL